MTIIKKIKNELQDPFRSFRIFEIIIAALCITIPAWLYLVDTPGQGDKRVFRESISKYVNMERNYLFGMLLCMAAMLFIVNGAVYFKNEDRLELKKSGKWYNIVLGICLLGVISFHYKDWPATHLAFGIIFFVGNALVMAFFHDRKYRTASIILAIITLVGFAVLNLLKVSHWLFWSEWTSLAVIGIHQILQATRVMQSLKSINSANLLEIDDKFRGVRNQ